MRACIERAWQSQTLALPNPSVACALLSPTNEVLALQAHTKAHTPHAEVLALRQAFNALSSTPYPAHLDPLDKEANYRFLAQNHSGLFKDCTLVVTLEPCNHFGKTPPCAVLLEQVRPKRVVVGALETSAKASGGLKRLKQTGIEVLSGVLEKPCNDLLTPFMCLENKGAFNLFKIATRLDGSYLGKISGQESQIFTHNQRTIANHLIISGKSVRTDRPTLNARLATPPYEGLCHVAILTRDTAPLDLSIPLFGVKGRRVQVCHEVEQLPLQQGFNVLEGGWGLFESLRNYIDMLLIHTNASLQEGTQGLAHHCTQNFKPLHSQILGQDMLAWLA
ncbi:bifunctional diaminohydroxyphosphoribosylaminopyrimidine deaminase/5-amino-6-(5-phosphoribosylamino)uracil reductase RibD [Helicobacter sp. NHP22-001]|uniref:bifunctional diaminohydroxyphosphoribosylaminopyrimidine deaminase/5-amino-6-(5-phosphoribosylamino)uracil reductase RibD n=1 Tax=Helicobacter sp. NHP22-001 TaxID=3040202 RepID=UPI00255226C8|nr:bifunctional diaminohydroxyphosphoribosylaminopyrimidine deaminase/5-amino-6-(5-phosphoribosylamino)uracil reductase RibD [Helicobacter sp. NHP22-001]